MQAANIVVMAPPGWARRSVAEILVKRSEMIWSPLGHDVGRILRQRNTRRSRAEFSEAVDDRRYPGLAVNKDGVEKRDYQQLLDETQE